MGKHTSDLTDTQCKVTFTRVQKPQEHETIVCKTESVSRRNLKPGENSSPKIDREVTQNLQKCLASK